MAIKIKHDIEPYSATSENKALSKIKIRYNTRALYITPNICFSSILYG